MKKPISNRATLRKDYSPAKAHRVSGLLPGVPYSDVSRNYLFRVVDLLSQVDITGANGLAICSQMCDLLDGETTYTQDVWDSVVDHVFPVVPGSTGRVAYPVPSATCRSPSDEFDAHWVTGTMWVGEYGNNRKQFLSNLIQYLEDVYKEWENFR